MENKQYILVREFCSHHQLEIHFMEQLEERGLVEINRKEPEASFPVDALERLEQLVRLHQELEIHPEDLDVVYDLMERLNRLETEMKITRAQLAVYQKRFLNPDL